MAPATVTNHLAHLSAFCTWTATHSPAGLLLNGDPTFGVEPLRHQRLKYERSVAR